MSLGEVAENSRKSAKVATVGENSRLLRKVEKVGKSWRMSARLPKIAEKRQKLPKVGENSRKLPKEAIYKFCIGIYYFALVSIINYPLFSIIFKIFRMSSDTSEMQQAFA